MVSKEEIQRLGFEVWADNQFNDLIEDFVMPGGGRVEFSGMDCTVKLKWDDATIHCNMRVHTLDGWKTYDKLITR